MSLLLRLAWPVMLSRMGILIMAFADIAMLGRYGLGAAGEANLGLAIFIPVLVFTIGLATGVIAVIAQAHGRGEWAECGRAWRRGMVWAAVLGCIGSWVVWQGEWVLAALGQAPELAEAGGAVARALAPGLLAQALFAVCAFYLEATQRPMPALIVMIFANIANVGLNWLLIFGNAGFPEMGAPGAALASTIVRYGAFAAMLAVILSQRDAVGAGVRGHWETFWGPGGWRAGWQMRRLGLSAGLSNGFETVGFAMMSLYAAELGRLALDAYSISHNLLSTVFMVGLGLAVATGVRVGIETGRGNASEAAFAGWCGLGTAIALMGVLAGLVVLLREEIALLYTNDPELVAHTAALFLFSACVFVPDSAQVVMGQAVRALGDAWVAIGIYAVCFLIMLVPLGWWLVYRAGADESALLLAIMAVCLLATLLLAWRFPGSDARWGAGGASHMSAGYPSQKDWWGMRAGEWLLFGMAYCFKLTTLWVNLWWLARTVGRLGAWLIPFLPGPRRRIAENLALVYPDASEAWRRAVMRGAADHFLRLCVEYAHLRRFARDMRLRFEGQEVLDAIRASDKGCVIVTAHYANWEAIRLALKLQGHECGIIYRAFNNRYLDRHAMALIGVAGTPVLQKGAKGMRALLEHVSNGGTAMVLVDQRTTGAPLIPFLGHPAETVTVAAMLAGRSGAMLVPARARREDDRGAFSVLLEAPVPSGDAKEMMAEVNRRIGAWIEEEPAQWFWLHRRWRQGGQER